MGRTGGAASLGAEARRWLYAVLAVLPFTSLYIVHYLDHSRGEPTGFITYDLPYYLANGREIFERGNGILYPNPYDPDPSAPAIYFHWLLWVLGAGVHFLSIDPGACLLLVGAAGALVCARLSYSLIERTLARSEYRTLLYFLLMWGGGVLCLAKIIQNLQAGRHPMHNPLEFDPNSGWWLLLWGRNFCLPTEAVYHALMAGAWLAVLSERWRTACLMALLLASTHPFTGISILTLFLVFAAVNPFFESSAPPRWFLAAMLFIAAAFFWYYGVFLHSIPQHQELQSAWRRDWSLDGRTMLLADGPVALWAAIRLYRDRGRPDRGKRLWICMAAVTFLLANHEWFVQPMQPVHFDRGYLWTPLFLLGAPVMQSSFCWLRERLPPLLRAPLLAALFLLFVSDNLVFLARMMAENPLHGFYLSPDVRRAFEKANHQRYDGVLIAYGGDVSYLAATYTSLRPFCGHWANTPNFPSRIEEQAALFLGGKLAQRPPWFIDFLLIRQDQMSDMAPPSEWELEHFGEWVLLRRRSRSTGPAPSTETN